MWIFINFSSSLYAHTYTNCTKLKHIVESILKKNSFMDSMIIHWLFFLLLFHIFILKKYFLLYDEKNKINRNGLSNGDLNLELIYLLYIHSDWCTYWKEPLLWNCKKQLVFILNVAFFVYFHKHCTSQFTYKWTWIEIKQGTETAGLLMQGTELFAP